MTLRLIDIAQADQLAAGNISLLMGVLTPQNLIQDFMAMARKILKSATATLIMQNEPYLWHESAQGFKAHLLSQVLDSTPNFSQDMDYQSITDELREQGFNYQQCAAFDLKNLGHASYGQLMVFDGDRQALDCSEKLAFIAALVKSFVQQIELRLELDELKQQYNKQRILNESKTKFFQIIAHDLRAPFHKI